MKKETVANKILNLLNTKGGFKPKDIIKETKLKPASVYTTLNVLRHQEKIAKEEDGVYISQTQTSTDTPNFKTLLLATSNKSVKEATPKRKYETSAIATVKFLQTEIVKLNDWCVQWRQKFDELEAKHIDMCNKYADSQAVIRYLEASKN
jgi:DeoR/GlpR family transcriptional regulator of sugar metabolism